MSEERDSPVSNIVHRYPDRVLFLVTHQCAMYCRHCTRRRTVGEEDLFITEAEVNEAVGYIAKTPADTGCPANIRRRPADNERLPALERIIMKLRAIDHVEVIRIGTRVPVVLPMRITPELLSMLKKYQPIWINTTLTTQRSSQKNR